MSKRFAVILGFTLLSAVSLSASLYAPSAAEAQRAGKVPHIIFFRSGPPPQAFVEAFQQGLREFGYVEGKTVIVEYRFSDGTTRLLPELAREIVGRKPDAILASAVPAALAARTRRPRSRSSSRAPSTLSRPAWQPAWLGPVRTSPE